MSDGTGLAEALLGLDGFKVLGVAESENELVIAVETTASDRRRGVGVLACWPSAKTASALTYAISPVSGDRHAWSGPSAESTENPNEHSALTGALVKLIR
jgi:hypothetical protein